MLLINLVSQLLFTEVKNTAFKFTKAIHKEHEYCKKVMKKYFNKNKLITEEEEQFQLSRTCRIFEKLIENEDEKLKSYCHINGKFRDATHWSCNINLQLTKKVPIIFRNLGYDSHLIFYEPNKFDVKIDVKTNRLEKYKAFILNKNLGFIYNMQFMNSGLEKLVKNLSDDYFKYLTEEFDSKNLELLKQKDAYPYEYMDSFKRFSGKKLPDKECFYSSVKDETTSDNGEKLDGQISNKDYLTCDKRYSETSNKYMKNYDYAKPSQHISYLDMNNLYRKRTSGYPHCSGFKWLKNVDDFDVNLISGKSLIGYIVEIDLKYHKELHKLHNDYPLAPE